MKDDKVWKFPEEKRKELIKIAKPKLIRCNPCGQVYECFLNATENFPNGCPECKNVDGQVFED